jgi:hypothetical protein
MFDNRPLNAFTESSLFDTLANALLKLGVPQTFSKAIHPTLRLHKIAVYSSLRQDF